MPKCPKCGAKLDKGAEICPACGFRPDESRRAGGEEDSVLLSSVWDPIEADLLRARLESAGIPFYMKPHDNGGPVPVIMGSNGMGGDFYVPLGLLGTAREAAGVAQGGPDEGGAEPGDALPEAEETSDAGAQGEAAEGPRAQDAAPRLDGTPRSMPKRIAWGILTLVIIGAVLAAYFLLDVVLDDIRKLFGY